MNQELVTYIVLGSYERLKDLKLPSSNNSEQYLSAQFSHENSLEEDLDQLIANSKGGLIVLLPPSSFPSVNAKKALKKISMIDLSTWGWFKFNKNNNDVIQNLKKISATIRSIPDIEQGIFFTKRLYFSVGGIGRLGSSPFKEISKRFYSRIDPQNSLPALIIRTKNFNIF